MNYFMVFYIIGWILEFEAAFLLLPALVGCFYGEFRQSLCFLLSALISFLAGFLLKRKKPDSRELYMREGFVTVSLGWFSMSAFGAIPFVMTGDIPHYIDALFEAISGFTTTGASILSEVEHLSHAGLFWRSFTHWIGGMGVFVFIMAILPLMGGSTMNLMRAESTGPSVDKLVPRVKDSAKILYELYIGLTILGAIVFMILGMTPFDAFATIFGTVGTGGFGIRNTSIASYSPQLQWAITVFMLLSGINYSVYFLIMRRRAKEAFRIEEVRWYLIFVVLCTGLISFDLRDVCMSFGERIRDAAFQVASIITTTGFSTVDFDAWPAFSKSILLILMFVGSCSGSTAGGIKISRIVILTKSIGKELSLMIHPRQVQKIRIDGRPVAHETVRATNVFLVSYMVVYVSSFLLLSINEYDFTTNFTAVAAMLGNIGPGFSMVGPTQNFGFFSPFSKMILMFDMLAGRLELFPLLILLRPAAWKKY
ncbi:MAG: TrkH family potassium uptake protein [Lachnospiraceae bacterium]|nr:TrkH family potassium uptake protein [Lachnospiraceae bacterium]